jgi:hypothetical protein
VALAFLLAVFLALSGVAFAEDRAWDGGPPKGMTDGLVCHGEASGGGNTYRYTNYIGADAGMMASDPARERRWQQATCDRYAREDVTRAFSVLWGQTIDPASVRVTWEPYRE